MFSAAHKRELLLQARVKELENILCPAEQHDWHEVGSTAHILDSQGTTICTKRLVCKRCYKSIEQDEWQ